MRGSPEERAAVRASFKKMPPAKKIDYILTYYRLPIFTAVVAIAVLISSLISQLTKKEPVLYIGFANVVVGETMQQTLTEDFLSAENIDLKKNEIIAYYDLYVSDNPPAEDHQYAYASKLKILGAINAEQMDLFLMNKEAWDQISASGFLLDLDELLKTDPALYQKLSEYLGTNTVILDDNSVEVSLGVEDTYESETEESANALDVSSFPVFRDAGFGGDIYLGAVANTKHAEQIVSYIRYITAAE